MCHAVGINTYFPHPFFPKIDHFSQQIATDLSQKYRLGELGSGFSEHFPAPPRENDFINEVRRVFETTPRPVKVGEIGNLFRDFYPEAKAMADPFVCSPRVVLSNVEAFEVHHWPIVRAYAQRLGLVEVINRFVPSEMTIDAGTVVLGLVIDTLSGRSPLYHLESFFEQQDRELLLGREVEASVFNDDSVGRVLGLSLIHI